MAGRSSSRNAAGGGPRRKERAREECRCTFAAVPVDVLTEIVIDRERSAVARFAADPVNAPKWYENIKAMEWKTPPPLALGSKVAFVAQFFGRRLSYTYEVVELVPEERLVMRTSEGPFPMETTYTWDTLGERRTRMTLRNRGEPSGFASVMAPVMAAAMQRANRKDLALLKGILEGRAGTTASKPPPA